MKKKVTSKDIAEACHVGMSTIRVWRTRFDDFPKSIESWGGTLVYDAKKVEAWLAKHGKEHDPL
jgi:hypothetical protein